MAVVRRVSPVLAVALLIACDGGNGVVRRGTALQPVTRTGSTIQPVPPGDEFVMLRAWVENTSDERVVLKHIVIKGHNLGRVVLVRTVQTAPLPGSPDSTEFVSGGIYKTYPPVWRFEERRDCNRQKVADVAGYVLTPGSFGRILVILRAKAVGDFSVLAQEVTYEQAGMTYSQSLPAQLIGRVTAGAKPLPLERSERSCIDGTVHVLGIR